MHLLSQVYETDDIWDTQTSKKIELIEHVRPLFMSWKEFKAYKHLENEVFIEEFTKEIFWITMETVVNLDPDAVIENALGSHTHQKKYFDELLEAYNVAMQVEVLLNLVDDVADSLRAIKNYGHALKPLQLPHVLKKYDLDYEISVDNIAQRFYLLRRLERAISLIQQTQFLNIDYTFLKTNIPLDNSLKHPSVTQAYNTIITTQSTKSLLSLWADLNQYKYLNDIHINDNYALLVAALCQHILHSIRNSERLDTNFFEQI